MRRYFWMIGSALGAAVMSYVLFPWWVAVTILAVLFAHEMGHYWMGSIVDAEVSPPVFIPLGWFIIGITRIQHLKEQYKAIVAMAGPVMGAAMAVSVAVCAVLAHSIALLWAALLALAFELYAALLGSDAKRYRRARAFMRGR